MNTVIFIRYTNQIIAVPVIQSAMIAVGLPTIMEVENMTGSIGEPCMRQIGTNPIQDYRFIPHEE